MARHSISVLTADSDLIPALQRRCPGFSFCAPDETSTGEGVVVIDSGFWPDEPLKNGGSRIFLRRAEDPEESPGTTVDRETFLAAPEPYLSLALDAADQGARAALLDHLRELLRTPGLGPLAEKITNTTLEILDVRFGSFLLNDPKSKGFVTMFTRDPDRTESGEFTPGVSPDLLRRALMSEKGFALDRAGQGSDGELLFRLQTEQELIGVLKIPLSAAVPFDESRAEGAREYLDSVMPVLQNGYQLNRARELALMDDLTRCFNRRFFEAYLDDEMERARRHRSVLSIIFLDLDDLKMVNSSYGHMAGSSVLQEVARRIMGAVRTIDKVIRFGGDEFCIILPQTGQEQATAVASRVRDAIGSEPCIVESDVGIHVTASFGIASYPNHAATKEDLISAADAAMLLVKSTTKDEIGVARAIDSGRGQARR